MSVGAVLMTMPSCWQRLSWKRTLRARKSSEIAAEGLQHIGAEQQRGLVGEAEDLERRHVGEGDRHVAQQDRTELELVDAGDLHV